MSVLLRHLLMHSPFNRWDFPFISILVIKRILTTSDIDSTGAYPATVTDIVGAIPITTATTNVMTLLVGGIMVANGRTMAITIEKIADTNITGGDRSKRQARPQPSSSSS